MIGKIPDIMEKNFGKLKYFKRFFSNLLNMKNFQRIYFLKLLKLCDFNILRKLKE